MNQINILVTGAGGMVGSHMVEFLHSRGDNVLGTYYKPTTNIRELSPEIRLTECDVRYFPAVEKLIMDFQPEHIYHLAAQSYPTVSWEKPSETMDVNVNGTISVFEAVKSVRKWQNPGYDPMVIVACSSAEYGETLKHLSNITDGGGACKRVRKPSATSPLRREQGRR